MTFNYKLKVICKEQFAIWFKAPTHHLPGEIMKHLRWNSQSQGRESNLGPEPSVFQDKVWAESQIWVGESHAAL
jgi:hypothetical protein